MSNSCRYQEEIPRLLFEDLTAQRRAELEAHLEGCLICRHEFERCKQTVSQLREWVDLPAPEHTREPAAVRQGALAVFSLLSPVWKGLVAASLLALVGAAATLVSSVEVSAKSGGVTFSWGVEPPPTIEQILASEQFQNRLSLVLEERLNDRTAQITALLRADLEESQAGWSEAQKRLLRERLASLETRLQTRLESRALDLEAGIERTNWALEALSRSQEEGFQLVNDRINLIAVTGEIQGSQNDFVLTALMEMADRGIAGRDGS